MTRREQLLQASYKGYNILVENESETGGRKLVLREYPNSNKREIQDMGGIPQKFRLSIVIHGNNYLTEAEKFRDLLIDGEEGELVLQNFGYVVASVESYSRNATQSNVGEIKFDVAFAIKEMAGGEDVFDQITEQDIYEKYDAANEAAQKALEENWQEPTTNKNIENAINDSDTFMDTVKAGVQGVKDAVRAAEKVKNEIQTHIMKANMFADLWINEGPLAALASATGFGGEYVKVKEMIAFGSDLKKKIGTGITDAAGTDKLNSETISELNFDIPVWDEYETLEWKERTNNRITMVESARGQALNYMLLNGPGHVGDTLDSIVSVKTELQDAFNELVYSDREKTVFENDDYLDKLNLLKATAFEYLQQKEENVYRQTTVYRGVTSPTVLAYELYAEQINNRSELNEKAEQIVEMNNQQHYLTGDINVLERD